LLAGSLHIVNNQTDVIMLGLLADPKDVGLYRVAQRGSELIIFSLTAVNMAIAPTVSQLYVQGDFERLQRIFSKSVRWIMVFSLPMALVLIFGGQYILRYVFGAEFVSGRNALAVLACAQLVNAGMGSVGLILNMTGHEKDTARVLLMTAVLNILLNALLIPLYGILGAALATGFSLVLWNVVLHILVYRRTCLKAHFFL
jgi:O-antigen/teichoic acid export membrane protein